MKAVILLAVLAVATARPEAPVDRRYLPPGNGANQLSAQYGPPSAQYGPPSYHSGQPITVTTTEEPVSYKFSYKVEDAEAGLDFGHHEEREGDEAMGGYRVLLPDGRTMIVTYTANQDGYKPEIKFEEPKATKNSNGYY